MTNLYYTVQTFTKHTLARAENMNTFSAAVVSAFDSVPAQLELEQGRVTFAADTGTANSYLMALTNTLAAYTTGLSVQMKVLNTNTGASTINIDSLGVKSIKRFDGSALDAGDMTAGDISVLNYDGTNFKLLNPSGTSTTTHAALTTSHGLSGVFVGTTDTQTLSNKTFSDTVTVDGVADSTSGTTGSIHTDGGVGISKKLFVGTDATVAGTTLFTGVTTHGGNVVSDTDSTDDLGTTAVRWKDLYVDSITVTDQVTATGFTGTLDGILGSGAAAAATVTTINASGDATLGNDLILDSDDAQIAFGDNQDVLVIHDPDDGLFLKSTATADDNPVVFTLQTGETDIQANDVLGRIDFQSPDEGTSGDSRLIAASIQARSEGDFSATSNATSLDFMTGASEAATTKMTLSSAGNLTVTGVTTHGGNVVSDTDSTDDLGTTSVRWKELFVDAITATDQITATGFTGTLDGILGSGSAAAATTTTLAATTITASGVVSVDDTTTSTSGTTGSIHTDGGLGVAGAAFLAGTAKIVGVTTHGGNVVSDTDSTDDLGTTSVRWKELFVDAITATDQVTATGFTGTLDGILGSGTPAAATATVLTVSADSVFSSTGALQISKGTTGQRPTAVLGMLRYNSTTSEFEGYSGASPAWKSVGGSAISNDTTTSSNLYPLSADAVSGTAAQVYTSNAKYLYKPSDGSLQAPAMVSTNGLVVNSATVSASYTIPSGSNAMSIGTMTVGSGVTVTISSGSKWVVI